MNIIALPLCVSATLAAAFFGFLSVNVLCLSLGLLWIVTALTIVLPSSRKKSTLVFLWYLQSLLTLSSFASASSVFRPSMDPKAVRRVEGRTLDDSIPLRFGGQSVRLDSAMVQDWNGTRTTARGCISVVFPSEQTVSAGSTIVFTGRLDEELSFHAKDFQVTSVSLLGEIRFTVMRIASFLLGQHIRESGARSLARLLLLAESDKNAREWKEWALSAGSSHLLALSGMHLGFLMTVLSHVIGYPAALVCSLLFVAIIGPKPSLVRSFIALFVGALLSRRRGKGATTLALSALIQLMLFPDQGGTLSFLLSYLGTASVTAVALLFPYLPGLPRPFVVGLFAVALSSPVSLSVTGKANLSGLFISPVATILVLASLYLAFLCLLPIPLFPWLLEKVSSLLSFLFHLFTIPLDQKGCVIFVLSVLTVFLLLSYATGALRRRRRHAYELELRLRFPFLHQAGA